MQTTKVETITPDFAKKLLANSKLNRKIQRSSVIEYSQIMKRGDWHDNAGEPIQILEDGSTGNGHHRAYAVILHGKPVRMLVSRGVPREMRLNVDRGLKRTLKDDFVMFRPGVKYSSRRAAYMRVCATMHCESVRLRSLADYDAWGKIFGRGVDWAAETFGANAGFARKMSDSGIAGALAFVHRVDTKATLDFTGLIISGAGLRIGDPAYALRNHIILLQAAGGDRGRSKGGPMARKVISLFDMFRNGERVVKVSDSQARMDTYLKFYSKAVDPLIAPWLQELPQIGPTNGVKHTSHQGGAQLGLGLGKKS